MNRTMSHEEKPQAFVPDRARLSLERNAFVRYGDDVYRINQVLDFKTVVGIDVYSGRAAALPVDGLKPVAQERLDGLYVRPIHDVTGGLG